jgi:hypothetical protein
MSTNFYEIYKKNGFVHSIRHLNQNIVSEIDYNIDLFNKYMGKNLISGVHYPNAANFNVLHIHFYSNNYGRILEISNNYTNIFYEKRRFYLWEKYKHKNFKKDIVISIDYVDQDKIKSAYEIRYNRGFLFNN